MLFVKKAETVISHLSLQQFTKNYTSKAILRPG
jgi:hypothetical protein